MADCTRAEILLDQWMDDALTDAERAELDAHCAECPACAGKARATEALRQALSDLPSEIDVPLQARAAWRGAVKAEADRARRTRRMRLAGGVAAALLVAVGGFLALRPASQPQAALRASEATAMGAIQNVAVIEADGVADEPPPLADYDEAYEADDDGACEAEAVTYEAAARADAADVRANGTDAGAAVPTHERRMRVQDLERTCAYMADLISEYEGDLDIQRFEADGAQCANLFIDLPAENAADFLNAAAHYDTGDASEPEPAADFGEGRVTLLLELTEE